MTAHDFCRMELVQARQSAKEKAVKVPKGLTAISCDKRQYFVESRETIIREYIKADCAYDAKAQYIYRLIDKAEEAK